MTGPEIYHFLCDTRAALLPACCEHSEHKGLKRQLRIEYPSLHAEELTLVSYNGYDRRERAARMSYRDLKMDLRAAFMKARDEVLTLDGASKLYVVQALADEVLRGMEIHGRGVEYDTWTDHITDNVIVKSYRRHPRRAGLAFAITRDKIMDYDAGSHDELVAFITKNVQEMADAYTSEEKLEELGAFYDVGQQVPVMETTA